MLCYAVYFIKFLGSEEAAKKSFPLHKVGDLLPSRADGEVLQQGLVSPTANTLDLNPGLLAAPGGPDPGPADVELLQAVLPEADPDRGRTLRHDLPKRAQLWRPGSLRHHQQPGLHGGSLHLPAH